MSQPPAHASAAHDEAECALCDPCAAMVRTWPWLELRESLPPNDEGSEAELQENAAAHLRSMYPEIPFQHSMNGGFLKGGHKAWQRLVCRGVSEGFPDLFIYLPSQGFHGLAIELKVQSRPLFPAQMKWLEALSAAGHLCVVIRDLDSFKCVVAQYLVQPAPTLAAIQHRLLLEIGVRSISRPIFHLELEAWVLRVLVRPSDVVSQVGSSSQVPGPSSESQADAETVLDSDADGMIDLEEDSD